jgi:XTP/dITP diphosphohydrolase
MIVEEKQGTMVNSIKRTPTPSIIIGTHNLGKFKEFQDFLTTHGIKSRGPSPDISDPLETGETFQENSLLKAKAYSHDLGPHEWVLADDSGLVVPSLKNMLGISTARFVQEKGGYLEAFQTLESMLGPLERKAYFVCVLTLYRPDCGATFYEGRIDGALVFNQKDMPGGLGGGFGFDPIFQPQGYLETFGQNPELKKSISHRHLALALFMKDPPWNQKI